MAVQSNTSHSTQYMKRHSCVNIILAYNLTVMYGLQPGSLSAAATRVVMILIPRPTRAPVKEMEVLEHRLHLRYLNASTETEYNKERYNKEISYMLETSEVCLSTRTNDR